MPSGAEDLVHPPAVSGTDAPRPLRYVYRPFDALTAEDLEQYRRLYNRIFDRAITIDRLRYKLSQQVGSAAHFVLMIHPDCGIVGSLGAIEVPYQYRGREYRLAITLDAMIDPDHRGDLLAMKRQHDILFEALAARGVVCVFTKPNNNSYLYLKKILGFRDAGVLHVQALPLRPLRLVVPRLGWLDPLWRIPLSIVGRLARPRRGCQPSAIEELVPAPPEERADCLQRRRDRAFLGNRYGQGGYHAVTCGKGWAVYALSPHEGRLACLVLEAFRFGPRDWLALAHHVIATHPDAEVMLEIRSERAPRWPLLPVPSRMLPNKLHIVARPLAPTLPDNASFSLQLSDFEVV